MRVTNKISLMMEHALLVAKRGTCSRAKVGAIIEKNGRIISTGYNGAPSGMPHCTHSDDNPCLDSVHAEVNAIAFAAKEGIATNGASLHTTLSPCRSCAQLIINAGISEVFYIVKHRDMSGIELLNQAGIKTSQHSFFKD